MKLVKIVHDRCDEYDGTTYALAPDDMNEVDIRGAIGSARNAHIKAAEDFKGVPPAPRLPTLNTLGPEYQNLTVRELQEEYERQEAAYHEAWAKKTKLETAFVDELRKEGLFPLDEAPDTIEVRLIWGHKHGLRLNYRDGMDVTSFVAPEGGPASFQEW